MIDQKLTHIKKYYIEDLLEECQEKIEKMNEDDYELIEYKFSNLEGEEGDSHAFLLFKKEIGKK